MIVSQVTVWPLILLLGIQGRPCSAGNAPENTVPRYSDLRLRNHTADSFNDFYGAG